MSKDILSAVDIEIANLKAKLRPLERAKIGLTVDPNTPLPGEAMPDGTVYAGVSPSTDRPLYVMPSDLYGEHAWAKAIEIARNQSFGGYKNWRLPTKEELKLLFVNRIAIRGFTTAAYWSATENHGGTAWYLGFQSEMLTYTTQRNAHAIRCVHS